MDQRGHGASAHLGEYTFEAMEKDLRSFVDALDIGRFALVAHSMGGTVGWLFAEKTPDRLDALIFEDTAPPTERHSYPDVPDTSPEPVDYDWEARRQLVAQLNSPNPSWWTDVGRVTTPTLVVAAGAANDDEMEETVARLPNGKLETIPTGHWIHETQLEAFVLAVRVFLADSVARH